MFLNVFLNGSLRKCLVGMEMYILIQFGSGLVGGGSFFEGEGKFLIYNQNGWNKIKQPFIKNIQVL